LINQSFTLRPFLLTLTLRAYIFPDFILGCCFVADSLIAVLSKSHEGEEIGMKRGDADQSVASFYLDTKAGGECGVFEGG
jgi:hypothetical protein